MSEMTTVAELPLLDKQNGAALGRLPARGGRIGHVEEARDGRMHAQVRIPPDELVWDPPILVMPHAGELELELVNDDQNTHCALLPSNGDNRFLWLPNNSKGRAVLELDGPGCYWFSSIIGNDEGRGLIAAIVVMGDTPAEARLDRPAQPRP
ncbi:MAG TPA: MSMEG_3727 family PQQ-associated protein [Thermoleophilaceae bacterium]|jgi:PQQ system protein|nr:MSMEG_3727 family PQQ-associated protein [Thermoleophilaceae bacterium]